MNNLNFKSLLPYIVAILVFVIASLAYFSPVLKGQKIRQSDIQQHIGMAKEIEDFRKDNQQAEPYWTNSAFGGMPAYNVSAKYPHNYIKKLDRVLRFLPRPADYLFLYFLGFFVLLTVLKVDWKLAILGALSFGFSTYFIIILGVGHNAKAHAIAYMPLVFAGILWMFQKRYLAGFVLTALAMALHLNTGHPQMTYYLLFSVLILGIVYLIQAFQTNSVKEYTKQIAMLTVAVLLAVGMNSTRLLSMNEYSKYSTRSASELTITPDGKPKEKTTGLSRYYITEYSYGKLEAFNLFIPRFMGGTAHEELEESELRNFLQEGVQRGMPERDANYLYRISSMYWGDQPIVSAPAYIGSILIFLFVLGLFLLKGPLKKWLVGTVIIGMLLSFGKNLSFLTDFFIDYVPMYNKFRAVSSIQVLVELAIPVMAVLTLKELFFGKATSEEKEKALKYATIIVLGLATIFTLGGTGLFTFETLQDIEIDKQLSQNGLAGYLDAITADRKALFFGDSLRTLVFVALAVVTLWLFIKEKFTQNIAIVVLGALIVFDLVGVDKRYVNDESFVPAIQVEKPFQANALDQQILKDKGDYRVHNNLVNPVTDASTSYFHQSVGGYHAAKMRRFQELYDYKIAKNDAQVLNMLNVKYTMDVENGKPQVVLNNEANGSAWLVQELVGVTTADKELETLSKINTKTQAVYNKNRFTPTQTSFKKDSLATLKLVKKTSNYLSYDFFSSEKQFAVFSEIFYDKGWNAYVNGALVPHYQVDYVLRGLELKNGKSTIEFKFEPTVIEKGSTITLASYALLLLIPFGWWFFEKKKDVQ